MRPERIYWLVWKEVVSFFGTYQPVVASLFISLLCGLVSVEIALSGSITYEDATRYLFYIFYIMMLSSGIIFTMSSFVNEKKQGTMELLNTLPVTTAQVVTGKFIFAALFLLFISFVVAIVYLLGIAKAPVYMVVSGIAGLFLAGCYAAAAGIFASSIAPNHFLAILIGAALLIVIDVGGYLSGLLSSPAREIFTSLHAISHFTPFTRGVISMKSLVFFGSFIFIFLYLSVFVIDSRKWRNSA